MAPRSRAASCALLAASLLSSSAVLAAPSSLGAVANVSCAGATCSVLAFVGASSTTVPLRLSFYTPHTVRWWLAVDGNFSDTGAADDVIVLPPAGGLVAVLSDAGAYYEVAQAARPSPDVVLRLNKSPATLSILVGGVVVFAEAAPLSWNGTSSVLTLGRDLPGATFPGSVDYFFGGGMQNGRFSHRDTVTTIDVDYNWQGETGWPRRLAPARRRSPQTANRTRTRRVRPP